MPHSPSHVALINDLLPPEIIAEIFVRCQDLDPRRNTISLDVRPEDRPTPTERLLALVCQKWRTIAIETPQLWTYVELDAPVAVIKAYLERSGSCDIQIVWMAEVDHNGGWDHFELAFSHISRWRIASFIHGTSGNMLNTLLRRLSSLSAPQLTHFSICAPKNPLPLQHWQVLNSTASRLQVLVIQGINLRLLKIPLSTLTTLKLIMGDDEEDLMSRGQLYSVLLAMPSLETLVLQRVVVTPRNDSDSDSDSPFSQHQTVIMASLRSLTIVMESDIAEEYPTMICRLISAPNLETLRLIDLDDAEMSELAREHLLQGSPYPQLRVLDLRPHPIASPDEQLHHLILSYLDCTPSIHHLILPQRFVSDIGEYLFRQDTDDVNLVAFLPLWDTLTLHCYIHESELTSAARACVDLDNIQDLIDLRFQSGPTSLTRLSFPEGCVTENQDILNECVRPGLEVGISPRVPLRRSSVQPEFL